MPGMVLATIFVSLPFVVREVMPVLREIGTDQEEAAYTLGASSWRTFWRVTLPSIRWGVIYGVILTTARSLGEFGAVAIVSGKISGKTETLTTTSRSASRPSTSWAPTRASIVLAVHGPPGALGHDRLSVRPVREGGSGRGHQHAASDEAVR